MDQIDTTSVILTLFTMVRIVAIFILASFMLLKALVFRRAGKFGSALAKSNVSIVVAFVGSMMLALGFGFFATWPWALGIVLVIVMYVTKAAQEMANLYGGWEYLMREAKATLRDLRDEWKRQRLGMKIAILIYALDLFAAVALSEVRGVPRELMIPPPKVKVQTGATPTGGVE